MSHKQGLVEHLEGKLRFYKDKVLELQEKNSKKIRRIKELENKIKVLER